MAGRQARDEQRVTGDERAMVSIGSTGLRRSGGFVLEDYQNNLRGWKGARYYAEMVNRCSVIGMSMNIIESLVRQVQWTVKTPPGLEEDERAIYWRDRVQEMIGDMEHTWEDLISEVLSFLPYGYAPFELVYKIRRGESESPKLTSQYDDGLWGWRKIEIRAQETVYEWDWDDEGTLKGFWQVDNYAPRHVASMPYIPIDKCILFRTKSDKNNPEGRSLLRSAVTEYHYLKRLQEIEAIGTSKDLTGLVVMQVPREILALTATPADTALRAQLEKMVQELQVDERMGALFPAELDREGKPTGFKLQLLASGGQRAINIDTTIRRYEMRIASAFLTEFQLIGQNTTGAYNLHESKSNLFGVALETVLDNITSSIQRFAIERVMRMNQAPREFWPVLTHGAVFSSDLAKLGTFVRELSTAGLLSPNRALEARLLENADLPVPPEEDDVRLDDSLPTPADGSDMASGILSPRQIDAVLQVNERLADGKINLDAARALLSSALGMDEASVMRYLTPPPLVGAA